MPKGFARVAAVSVPVHVGNVEANVQEILSAMEHLREKQVQVAVFPELCLTGATLGDLLLRPDMLNAAWEGMQTVARETGDMTVVVGLPVCEQGRIYNCAAVLGGGGLIGREYKSGLTLEEQRWFTADGEGEGLFETADGAFTFSVEIGADRKQEKTADLVLNPAADTAISGSHAVLVQSLSERSRQLCGGYVYACAGFGESTADHVNDGWAGIFENGKALAEGPRFSMQGGMAITDIDVDYLRYQRQRTLWYHAAPVEDSLWQVTVGEAQLPLLRTLDPLPFVPQGDDAAERCEEMTNIQCIGLCTRLKAINCKDLVIGVSGGLDSTLALLVAVRSFDMLGLSRKGIHAITMPGMGTGARTKSNADKLMEALGVTCYEIPIGPAVKQHFADIGQPEGKHDVTYENSQARERTQILMDFANKVNGIVLGTGDLSEEALGFCTYNGDHMSMYNVNCTIPKTLVKSLTRYLSGTFDETVAAICLDVVNTPISPELLPVTEGELNQRTEDILGDYALHDFFLYHFMKAAQAAKSC